MAQASLPQSAQMSFANNSLPQSILQPPTQETPLANNPYTADQFGSASGQFRGGSQQAMEYQAFEDFKSQFGRNPTQSELSILAPSYSMGDPNLKNNQAGQAAIASYYNSQAQTPTNIAAQQQQSALVAYNKNPGQFDTQTNQIFQQMVGRNANSDEATHFGSLLASGQIDSYGMGQLLGQSQESQQYQTANYQRTLAGNLQQTQSDYYQKYILPGIQSQFSNQGRSFNSSGFANAAVQAGQQQNYQLQNYLAQFGAGQYGQSAQNQQNVYQQYLAQQYGLQNAGISQQLGQQNYLQNYNTQLANYQMQQQAYNNYLQNYGQRSNGLGGLIGGVAGGALGSFGGPAGMAAGYQLGSGLGQGIQGAMQPNRAQQPNQGFSYGGLPTSWGRGGGGGGLGGYGGTPQGLI